MACLSGRVAHGHEGDLNIQTLSGLSESRVAFFEGARRQMSLSCIRDSSHWQSSKRLVELLY